MLCPKRLVTVERSPAIRCFCQCSHGVLGSVPTPPLLRHQSRLLQLRPSAGRWRRTHSGSLAATAQRHSTLPRPAQSCATCCLGSVGGKASPVLTVPGALGRRRFCSNPCVLAHRPQARRGQGSPAIPERRAGPRSWRSGGARGTEPAPSPSLIWGSARGRERGGKMGSSPPSPSFRPAQTRSRPLPLRPLPA